MARAGVLALAVLWGAGVARAQRPTFTWDVPRVLETVDVPGVMRADGIPVKLRSVRSAERPEVILQHLVDRFQAAGFYIPPDAHRTQRVAEPQLTALDTDRLISYTFFLQANRDGTTTVLLGEANLKRARKEQHTFAPVFPGGTDLLRSEMEGARTLSYTVKAEPAKVGEFYLTELRTAGFTEEADGVWRRGGEELRVGLRPGPGGRVSVLLLLRTHPDDGVVGAQPQTDAR
ncbi:hypothetical protein [Archangium sp.]|uniref:hypothetical protein n=1 Tax=Archangium sp. TaxID=1872627 RepID=UPI00286AB12D|nr:hypothetical protein [Archangium sp.]